MNGRRHDRGEGHDRRTDLERAALRALLASFYCDTLPPYLDGGGILTVRSSKGMKLRAHAYAYASLVAVIALVPFASEECSAFVSVSPSTRCVTGQSRLSLSPSPTSSAASAAADDIDIDAERQTSSTCSLRIPNDVALPILYESERVIAINKPHGIPHHDDADSKTPGILTVFRHLQSLDAAQSANAIDYKGRVYGVHRLDRVTSGILLLAKDKETAGLLTKKFRQKDVTKYYFAISSKKPKKKKQGWVLGDMAKGRRGYWLLQKSTKDPAITRFFTAGLGALADDVVEEWKQLGADTGGPMPKTAILFRPHTGRTHQLRVAAKSIGLPILMDPYYGDGTAAALSSSSSSSKMLLNKGVQRTYLHAAALHVSLGDDGEGKGDDGGEPGYEDITIWCTPPFEGLWKEEATAQFHDVVTTLMLKNCECDEIESHLRSTGKY